MNINLKFPKYLSKEMEDAIIDWMRQLLKNPSVLPDYSPLKYIEDFEVER